MFCEGLLEKKKTDIFVEALYIIRLLPRKMDQLQVNLMRFVVTD